MRRLPIWARWAVFAVAVVLFGLVFREQSYLMRVGILALLYAVLTVSLNLVNGFTGLFSLGHAAFYGVGAYASALLALRLGWPFLLAIISAAVVAALFGLLLSLPSVRLRGIYLAIVTLAFAEIVRLKLINLQDLTRGPFGLPGIPSPDLFGVKLVSDFSVFLLALVLLLVAVYVVESIVHSRVGDALLAIRDDEQAAAACGIPIFRYKVLAFVTAAFIAGLAGSLYAHYTRFISPDSFTLNESFIVLSMLVLGGLGSTAGAVLGAVILTALPEFFRFAAEYRMLIYGIVLTLVILFRPQGVLGSTAFTTPGLRLPSLGRLARGGLRGAAKT